MSEQTERLLEPEDDREGGGEAGEAGAEAVSRPRRRRRGGRGRGRSRTAAGTASEPARELDAAAPEPRLETPGIPSAEEVTEGEASGSGAQGQTRRRRRRGGRGRGGRARSTVGEGTPEPSRIEPESAQGEAGAERPQGEAGAERPQGEAGAETPTAARRRRRGGRGRRGRGRGETEAEGQKLATAVEPEAEGEEPEPQPASARRPRARKVSPESATAEPAAEPERAAPRGRRSRAKAEEEAPSRETEAESPLEGAPKRRGRRKVESAESAAPTRLRRARQSPGHRRREPLPVVPRVTDKVMVITEHGERDQIAILEGRDLVQHYVTRAGARSMVGNVYLGRVQNVLPGMEAAFIDVGRGRNAVLYAGEVNYSPEDLESGSAPRIEQVLKSGQSVLVQVTKDPIGGKGARLTAQISLPGRYLVLVPDSNVTGISRRLPDAERRRLKAILRKIRPEGHGLIVRTAAEGASEDALAADLGRVLAEWEAITKRAKRAKAPAVVYEEPELTVRAVRDLFNDEEFRELVTDSPRIHALVTEYLGQVAPDLLPKVRLHTGKLPVFEEFHIVEQIHKGLDRKVWLPSGGYIVIDRTEALTVIDVNTGKSVGKTNLEETVVNTNIEAAREVARQLRLRDIGGIIIIDFIDMLLEQNKKKVVDALKEEMARDKTRSQVFDVGPLGLVEVTRKRVSGGLLESFSETCPTCEGRGVLLTYEA